MFKTVLQKKYQSSQKPEIKCSILTPDPIIFFPSSNTAAVAAGGLDMPLPIKPEWRERCPPRRTKAIISVADSD